MARAWVSLGVLLLMLGLAACAPFLSESKHAKVTTAVRRQSLAAASCAITGNSDFYGLGIRIGIYLQWTTAFLANHLLRESIDTNLETNTIFLLALFIATVVATINDTVQTSELVVLLHLCFGFLFSILSIWGHRTGSKIARSGKIRFPLIGSFFRLTLVTAVTAYGLWFWFQGSRSHHRNLHCENYTFLFTKLNVAGPVSIFFKVQSCLILIAYAILFSRELLMIISFFCFVTIQTAIIAAIAVWFRAGSSVAFREKNEKRDELVGTGRLSPRESRRMRNKSYIREVFSQWKLWFRLSFAMGWKHANGKESAGKNRPDLDNYLIPFANAVIFVFRTTVQLVCLFFFKRCPPIDFIPMLVHPVLTLKRPKEWPWTKMRKQLRVAYE
jgi:protein-S-isoprenylcysteine O-methyltransferase Ste14